jgi:hypothetical protein
MAGDAMKPHIEILSLDGCPNVLPTQALVEQVVRELELEPLIEMIDVPDAESAERLRFLGSPSMRVNGVDVEPGADERHEYVFSCRVYRTPQGYAGRPAEEWLRAALRNGAGTARGIR